MFRREQSGSGFIVDRNGYILTNNHVVDKVDKITVKLHGDDTEYRARLIGYDRETDLAVIKIDPRTPLAPVAIGNSDGLQVGDWAVAIGSPFGLEASVTAGIVSATGRDIGTQQFQRFIQTDAAINPGNSGGPLANIHGEVIGVNTMIATQSGGYQGIGFALPINMAVRVYNDIIRNGRVVRGSIGIGWLKANEKPELFKALGTDHGVLVSQVTKGGPAEKAGVKPEDIIVAYNGKSIKDGDDLLGRVANSPVGSSSTVTVDRGGKRIDFKVGIVDRAEMLKLGNDARAAGDEPPEVAPSKSSESTPTRFGMKIRVMNESDRATAELKEKKGVVVTTVDTNSFADDLGLMENDVIVGINRDAVTSPEDVQRIQASLKPGQAIAVHVYRNLALGGQAPPQWQSFFLSGTVPGK
jgi:serine protease Do